MSNEKTKTEVSTISITPLPSPWRELAEMKTGETDAKILATLPKFRLMVKEDGRCRCPQSDVFLLRFLRYNHFDIDKAFTHIVNYCKMAHDYPTLFIYDIPSFLKRITELHMPLIMSKKMDDGTTIAIAKSGAWDPDIATVDDMFAAVIMLTEYLLRDRMAQSLGAIFIVDCKGLCFRQCRQITPSVMQKGLRWLQDCTPVIHNEIHAINTPLIFDVIYSLFSKFASKEIRKKLVVHGKSLDSLHKRFPKSHLPEEYGGTDGPWNVKPLIDDIVKNHVQIADDLDVGILD